MINRGGSHERRMFRDGIPGGEHDQSADAPTSPSPDPDLAGADLDDARSNRRVASLLIFGYCLYLLGMLDQRGYMRRTWFSPDEVDVLEAMTYRLGFAEGLAQGRAK